jgi:hypothetical protein
MTSKFPSSSLYEEDYNLWLEQTSQQLRDAFGGQNLYAFKQLDFENLIEEIEDMGRSQKNALASNTTILLMHLLKYQYQPDKRSSSWRSTIVEHRRRILRALKNSPSLKPYLQEIFSECYEDARVDAATETQLPLDSFLPECPFALEEVLNPEFLPE